MYPPKIQESLYFEHQELEDRSQDVFPVPTTAPVGICDVVQEAANQRVIIEESHHSIPAQQITVVWRKSQDNGRIG